jgi:glycosyltransferase involved in cell wall biosynthesis
MQEVRALAADPVGSAPVEPPDDLPVEVIDVSGEVARGDSLRGYVEPRDWLGQGAFAERAEALAEDADAVLLDETDCAPLAKLADGHTLLHMHCLAARDRPLRPPWARETRDTLKARRAERLARRRAPHLLANSLEVANDLRATGAQHVQLAPLGLDPTYYEPRARPDHPVAGLIGTASWAPTTEAIHRLLADIWPRVHARRPDAVLRLAGRGLERSAFPEFDGFPGVEWAGEVSAATGFLNELSLLLYPVTRGSGTKVKTLESMLLEVPVVTTAAGAEGIAGNEGVVVRDDDAGLRDVAVELLGDRATQGQRGRAGRDHAISHHSPPVVGEALAETLEAIAR